jgi:hypothetical protein
MREADDRTGVAFVSYSRDDSARVDVLVAALQAAGVRVWRDTADLWPGEDWRAQIRAAITRKAFVFIACFSAASLARATSYQNEELALAIDEMRLRPAGLVWLIPVRLTQCQIPDLDLGAGRTLSSIQHADLFGPGASAALDRLVASVRRSLGQLADHDDPITDDPITPRREPGARQPSPAGTHVTAPFRAAAVFIGSDVGQVNIREAER